MTLFRRCLDLVNIPLNLFNLKINTLSQEKYLADDLTKRCNLTNYLDEKYNLTLDFSSKSFDGILSSIKNEDPNVEKIIKSGGEFGYDRNNKYYNRPDFDVLYAIIKKVRPSKIVEIGCGNSTKIMLSAIKDSQLKCDIICIDPFPRIEIANIVNNCQKKLVQESNIKELVSGLNENDILFIDTSHEVIPGNDCSYLYCEVLPLVPKGVLIHVHDIYLPYEYPKFIMETYGRNYGEQSIVSIMLMNKHKWELFFPTYYFYKNGEFNYQAGSEFISNSSFWLKKL